MQSTTTPKGKPVSFREWISQHVNQDTAFGDLARDIASDAILKEYGPVPRTSKLDDWMNHIVGRACWECKETMRCAFREYDAYRATVTSAEEQTKGNT
jgi:hypothetical protein